MDELIAGRFPSLEDRFRVSLLVALQAVRGPGFRQEMERIATLAARTWWSANVSDAEIRERLENEGRPYAAPHVRAYRKEVVKEDGWTFRMSQPHVVQEALKHGVDTVMPMVYFRAWRLVRFKGPVLLTSDAPVAAWSPPRPDGLPVGFANAREVYMPLNRWTALVITDKPFDEDAAEPVVHARTFRAVRISTAVADGAHRWLFHHPDDRPLDRIKVGPPSRWKEETVFAAMDDEGSVRVRKVYVRRPVGGTAPVLSTPGTMPAHVPLGGKRTVSPSPGRHPPVDARISLLRCRQGSSSGVGAPGASPT